MMGEVVSDLLDRYMPLDSKPAQWDLNGLRAALGNHFGVELTETNSEKLTVDSITELVKLGVKARFDRQQSEIGEMFPRLAKTLLLQTIDQRWKEHLQFIDHLRDGINLRAYAQKDPLIEYKKEGFVAFQTMSEGIRAEAIEKILRVRIVAQEETEQRLRDQLERRSPQRLQYQGSEASDSASFLKSPAQSQQEQQRGQSGLPGFPNGDFSQDEGPKLNRAQRRKLEKKKKR
jgi:preprotein translocase subunit SecA